MRSDFREKTAPPVMRRLLASSHHGCRRRNSDTASRPRATRAQAIAGPGFLAAPQGGTACRNAARRGLYNHARSTVERHPVGLERHSRESGDRMRRSAARPNPASAGVTGTTGSGSKPRACFGSRSHEGDGSPLAITPRSGCRRRWRGRPRLWHSPLQAGLAGDAATWHRHRTAALEGGQFLGVELIRHARRSAARHMPILVAGRGLTALWHPSGAVRPTNGGCRRGHRGHRRGGRGRHRCGIIRAGRRLT
jgi:hypothetical protein